MLAYRNGSAQAVIGRPCSGKTTVASALLAALAQQGVRSEEVYYFDDYEVLYGRFCEDKSQRIFTPAEQGGFSVHDFPMLDTVLQQAGFRLSIDAPFYRACIVEFARNDYTRSLVNFGPSILRRSTVVHVRCSPKKCHERNEQRRDLSSDHRTGYIPEHILNPFYANENMNGVTNLLQRDIIEIDTDQVPLEQLQSVIQTKLLPGVPPIAV
jgi:tRNA uridine 5-carbamoylmethylation protein Kti12